MHLNEFHQVLNTSFNVQNVRAAQLHLCVCMYNLCFMIKYMYLGNYDLTCMIIEGVSGPLIVVDNTVIALLQ